jgi:hypothetical protein
MHHPIVLVPSSSSNEEDINSKTTTEYPYG